MKRAFVFAFLGLALAACGCKPLKYVADTEFISSATANSPEYFVSIDGRPCKDMDGIIGFCSKRLKKNLPFKVKVDPRPYTYKAIFDCTNTVQTQPESVTVQAMAERVFEIPAINYGAERIFNCSLFITPMDRPEPIGAFARMQVNLIDEDYTILEKPAYGNEWLLFGQHSLYVMYLMDDGWHYDTKLTAIKDKEGQIKKAWVESFAMRNAYWGM